MYKLSWHLYDCNLKAHKKIIICRPKAFFKQIWSHEISLRSKFFIAENCSFIPTMFFNKILPVIGLNSLKAVGQVPITQVTEIIKPVTNASGLFNLWCTGKSDANVMFFLAIICGEKMFPIICCILVLSQTKTTLKATIKSLSCRYDRMSVTLWKSPELRQNRIESLNRARKRSLLFCPWSNTVKLLF